MAVEKHAQQTGVFVVILFFRRGFLVVGFVCAIFVFVVVFVLPLADLFEAVGEESGFDAEEALKAPLGGGHLVDEEGFELALGLVLGDERGEEVEVLGAVLDGEDGLAGEEAVADGIEAGAGVGAAGLLLAIFRHFGGGSFAGSVLSGFRRAWGRRVTDGESGCFVAGVGDGDGEWWSPAQGAERLRS
jgi:hypothetical protein